MIRLVAFDAVSDPSRYSTFNRIRWAVFNDELGWKVRAASEETTRIQDPFDEHATFWMAETEDGIPVGIIRTLDVRHAFPHRELFEHHLQAARLDRMLSRVGTLNALAVLPAFRRMRFTGPGGLSATASAHLLSAALEGMATDGVRIALATVLGIVSAHVFLGAGFRLLDSPKPAPGRPNFKLANVGAVLRDPERGSDLGPVWHRSDAELLWASRVLRVEQYFAECHQQSAATRDLGDLFASESMKSHASR